MSNLTLALERSERWAQNRFEDAQDGRSVCEPFRLREVVGDLRQARERIAALEAALTEPPTAAEILQAQEVSSLAYRRRQMGCRDQMMHLEDSQDYQLLVAFLKVRGGKSEGGAE